MRRISLTVAFTVALSLPAFGAYDLGLNTFSEGDPYDEANKSGINSCIHQSKLTNGMLVQLVETYYAQNPDSWVFNALTSLE